MLLLYLLGRESTYDVRGRSGVITLPGYPNQYSANKFYSWYVTVPRNFKIQLKFTEFDLEAGPSCKYDSLQIHDGYDVNANKLGTFCGNSLPGTFKSTGNKMYLRFLSDDRQNRNGFKIEWKAVGLPTTSAPTTTAVKCKILFYCRAQRFQKYITQTIFIENLSKNNYVPANS